MIVRGLPGSEVISWQNPAPLFDRAAPREFLPAADGRTSYVIAPNPDAPAREIRVVQNWFEELKRLD
jgi:hypothetical protein